MAAHKKNDPFVSRLSALQITSIAEYTSGDTVWGKIRDIHILHDHYLQSYLSSDTKRRKGRSASDSAGKEQGLGAHFDELLDVCESIYELIEEFRDTGKSADFDKMARSLGAGSDIVSMFEEYHSGEDPVKDILLNGIPFILSRMGETAYIRSAEVGFKTVFHLHTVNLYRKYWAVIKQRGAAASTTFEDSQNIGTGLDALRTILTNRELDRQMRFMLHILLYVALFNHEIAVMLKELKK